MSATTYDLMIELAGDHALNEAIKEHRNAAKAVFVDALTHLGLTPQRVEVTVSWYPSMTSELSARATVSVGDCDWRVEIGEQSGVSAYRVDPFARVVAESGSLTELVTRIRDVRIGSSQ